MSYPFMVRAFRGFPGGIVFGNSGSQSGTLKRYSMIGDGLSAVGSGALAIAAALNMAPWQLHRWSWRLRFCFFAPAAAARSRRCGNRNLISTGALAIGIMVDFHDDRNEQHRCL